MKNSVLGTKTLIFKLLTQIDILHGKKLWTLDKCQLNKSLIIKMDFWLRKSRISRTEIIRKLKFREIMNIQPNIGRQ